MLRDHVVGVLIESNLNDEVVHEVHTIILERFKENKKINLFIEIRKGSTISLAAFLKDMFFTLKPRSIGGSISENCHGNRLDVVPKCYGSQRLSNECRNQVFFQ